MTSNVASSDMPPDLTVTSALAPTPVGGPETRQLVSRWSVKDSWLAITSRNAYTSSRAWGTSMETVTGEGMYHMVHFSHGRRQPPRTAPQRGHRPHRRARDQRPVAAAAGGRDRLQPPDADPPLRRSRGPAGGRRPGRRAAPARPARGRRPRPRGHARRRDARLVEAHLGPEP